MEQVNKVVKVNEDSLENEEQVKAEAGGERNDNELSYMDKLPNEILMKILDYLDEEELVKCRLLNRRWNEICCLLLQEKTKNNPYSNLVLKIKKNMECKTVIKKSLADFIDCFSPSEAEKSSPSGRRRPFPFSHFIFKTLNDLDWAQICKFVSTFGPQMKTINVYINPEDIANFERLWRLFLHFAPNIQHLKINGDSCLKNVQLFDPVAKFITESDPSFKVVNPSDTFLTKLIKLEIVSSNFGEFNNFMKDLLDNTPNLQQVSSMNLYYDENDELLHLKVWQQLGKAHLLKKLGITSDTRCNLPPSELMKNLRLVDLTADCTIASNSKQKKKSNTRNYIYYALKSSQNTLTSLDLYSLTMESLNLCFKDISSLPNVRQLVVRITEPIQSASILERISQICPNITDLDFGIIEQDFSQVALILWTGFKRLKSLQFSLILDSDGPRHLLDLDSQLSGYSIESIQRIRAKLNNGISLEEARRGEPQKTSILDLKDLKELIVEVGESAVDGPNWKDQVENFLFSKLLSHLHTKKLYVNCNKQAFSDSFESDSDLEYDL